jgi:hypothetical protein
MIKRSILSAAVLALGFSAASAQPTYSPTAPVMPAPYNSTRVVSPFFQMLRGGDAAANYYGGVLPEQQRRFSEDFLNYSSRPTFSVGRLENMVDDRLNLDVLEKQLPPTGHPTGFMIYNAYYNLPNQRSFIPYNPRPMVQGQMQTR